MNEAVDFNEIFNDSYSFILEHEAVFYNTFYELFLDSSPRVREIFKNTNIDLQKKILHGSIVNIINFSVSKIASSKLIALAHQHKNDLHIDDELYDLFIDTFLKALEKTYPKYNKGCEVAWRVSLAPGVEFMKHM